MEWLAAGEEPVVHGGERGDAQGVPLAAPYGHLLVERGPLDGLQFGAAEEVSDPARQVQGDRQLRGRDILLLDGGAVGQEVGDGCADGAAADLVVPGEGGNGAALR